MAIEVYPNLLDGGPCDTLKIERRMTIAEWLNEYCVNTGGYKAGDYMPALIKLDDEIIPESEWALTTFRPRDRLEVRAILKAQTLSLLLPPYSLVQKPSLACLCRSYQALPILRVRVKAFRKVVFVATK